MLGLKLAILWVIGILSITGALAVSQTGDLEVSGVLTAIAGVTGATYFTLRGLALQTPRFLDARRGLMASLIFMLGGAGVFSIGSLRNLLSGGNLGVSFKLIGVVMFVAAVSGFILSLTVSHRKTR